MSLAFFRRFLALFSGCPAFVESFLHEKHDHVYGVNGRFDDAFGGGGCDGAAYHGVVPGVA